MTLIIKLVFILLKRNVCKNKKSCCYLQWVRNTLYFYNKSAGVTHNTTYDQRSELFYFLLIPIVKSKLLEYNVNSLEIKVIRKLSSLIFKRRTNIKILNWFTMGIKRKLSHFDMINIIVTYYNKHLFEYKSLVNGKILFFHLKKYWPAKTQNICTYCLNSWMVSQASNPNLLFYCWLNFCAALTDPHQSEATFWT